MSHFEVPSETRNSLRALLCHLPRYYFNIYGDDVCIDDDGIELADEGVVREEAMKGARSFASR